MGFAALPHANITLIFATRINASLAFIATVLLRTWIRVYVVLKGRKLNFYIPEFTALTYQNEGREPALDLAGCTAKVAVDYTKKLHVFRLR